MKNKRELERRSFPVQELRVVSEGEAPRIVGYAAVFDELSENLGGFREKIRPGAFKKTVKESDIRALWNHDSNFVLGRTAADTLELTEDEHGLKIDITPPDTQWARDLMVSIERGDVSQMSFGFRTIRDEWSNQDDERETIRELIEVRLFDVSPVTFPAYPQTEVQLRSVLGMEMREIEVALSNLEAGNITEEDSRFLENLREVLDTRLTAAPGQEAHPVDDDDEDTSSQVRLAAMHRRLELLETIYVK